ncbi:MAG: lipid-binding SYLF domain-containing protein [Planctomycetaceae bacterium]|nr:lipid-binding SYLF domain-containing protein [Planctomycetaceae bacterium]
MSRKQTVTALILAACWLILGKGLMAQSKEDTIIEASSAVLDEIMAIPLSSIPESMLADAQGLVIIPNMVKGGFVVGGRHGRGVLLVRDEDQSWHAPVFVSLTGGSIGWQVGVQTTDVILVFKTRQSVQGILNGKFTLGADAAAAAGPVGRQAAAATDGRFKAEIYSYSRSRGLFAGVSIDGSVLQLDQIANAAYYRSPAPGTPPVTPQPAIDLVGRVVKYCGAPTIPAPDYPAGQAVHPAPAPSVGEAEVVRNQLAQVAPQLYALLDSQWSTYLALPPEIFTGQGHPAPEALNRCLGRFKAVTSDARYMGLAQRAEFQSTYGLLQHYASTLTQAPDKLEIPPPPAN